MANLSATIEYYNGSTWTNITSKVNYPRKWSRGIKSASPTDRIAETGTLEFTINNASPYIYSPDSGSAATGWDIGAKVRISLTNGSTTKYWQYRIEDIDPPFGQYLERKSKVYCTDYMEEFSRRKISGLVVQTDKKADELLTLLVAQMPIAPAATSYDTGLYIHPFAFAEEKDEDTYCTTVLQKIGQSGMVYIYLDGAATVGETLKLEAPQKRYHTTTVSGTFNNTMINMEPRRSRRDIFNNAKTTITPLSVAIVLSVVGTSDEEIVLEPGETKTIKIRYVDTGTSRRVSAVGVVSPVSGTDYIMYSKSGGQGTDTTANLTATGTDNGNSMTYVLTNTSTTAKGYIPEHGLQARGYQVTAYNKQDIVYPDSTSINTYGQSDLPYVLPYIADPEIAKTIGVELVRRNKDPHTNLPSIQYNANRTSTFAGYAVSHNIGNRITVTEAASSISADYFINGYEYEMLDANNVNVTYFVERAFGETGVTYFKLGTSTLASGHKLIPL